MKNKEGFPTAVNESGYTYTFEAIFNSRNAAHYHFSELLRDKLPDDSKYRIIKKEIDGIDAYALYTW